MFWKVNKRRIWALSNCQLGWSRLSGLIVLSLEFTCVSTFGVFLVTLFSFQFFKLASRHFNLTLKIICTLSNLFSGRKSMIIIFFFFAYLFPLTLDLERTLGFVSFVSARHCFTLRNSLSASSAFVLHFSHLLILLKKEASKQERKERKERSKEGGRRKEKKGWSGDLIWLKLSICCGASNRTNHVFRSNDKNHDQTERLTKKRPIPHHTTEPGQVQRLLSRPAAVRLHHLARVCVCVTPILRTSHTICFIFRFRSLLITSFQNDLAPTIWFFNHLFGSNVIHRYLHRFYRFSIKKKLIFCENTRFRCTTLIDHWSPNVRLLFRHWTVRKVVKSIPKTFTIGLD